MRLSATDVYALQALGYLATQPRDTWVGTDAIGAATQVARPYLARVLAMLVGSGIVLSKKGTGGGYALAREPSSIDLREVMRAIDGPVAPLSCVSRNWYEPCVVEDRCHARVTVWTRVRDAVLEALSEVSVADLAVDFRQHVDYRPCLDHLLRPGA